MAQIAQTTKLHRKKKVADKELDTEALELAKRVSALIKQPTPAKPQPIIEDEYEPHDMVIKPKRKNK